MTPSERQLRGRLGGFALAAKRDPKTYTASARVAFMDRFLNEVDPERILTPDERERRAVAARRAYFARLAMTSARSRRRAKAKRDRLSSGKGRNKKW